MAVVHAEARLVGGDDLLEVGGVVVAEAVGVPGDLGWDSRRLLPESAPPVTCTYASGDRPRPRFTVRCSRGPTHAAGSRHK